MPPVAIRMHFSNIVSVSSGITRRINDDPQTVSGYSCYLLKTRVRVLQEMQDNSFQIAALNSGREIFCDGILTKKIDLGYLYTS